MSIRLAVLAAATALISGCYTTTSNPYMGPSAAQTSTQVKPAVDEPAWMKVEDFRHGGPVPPMEPNRMVNEQPCTEGIALTAGNLKCK